MVWHERFVSRTCAQPLCCPTRDCHALRGVRSPVTPVHRGEQKNLANTARTRSPNQTPHPLPNARPQRRTDGSRNAEAKTATELRQIVRRVKALKCSPLTLYPGGHILVLLQLTSHCHSLAQLVHHAVRPDARATTSPCRQRGRRAADAQ